MSAHAPSDARWREVQRLRSARPRSRALRWSVVALALLAAYAWLAGDVALADFLTARRLANLRAFVADEVWPHDLAGRAGDLGAYARWALARWREVGASATLATLWISVAAIVLAGAIAWLVAPLAARNVTAAAPFGEPPRHDAARRAPLFVTLRWTARGLAILMRAVPEYVLAFLLLAVLGSDTAWPAVLALALHNGGILGRLTGETLENLEPAPLRALAGLGARRRGVLLFAAVPMALGRFLLYFFYRFETCVREATVLGMLGVVSLGYWIQDARTRQFYDEMVFLVGLGVLLVLLADLTSAVARRWLRRS
ncbi:MAG: ABC transporter permease subunit [Planctomycetes bacterium]|nr:ABC transporter permease subunit [Planctomycetota bacterium]